MSLSNSLQIDYNRTKFIDDLLKYMVATLSTQTLLKRHIALPQDHGSWVFLFSPLLIGLFAAGRWQTASAFLVLACVAAFLIRQPLTIIVKAYSGRRGRRDLPVAWFWAAIYTLLGLLGIAGLVYLGHGYLVYLAAPGVVVFVWHLVLVSRRDERRQLGVELVASGVLALAAPAALWVGSGQPHPDGWRLWFLVWAQSAASIVYAYLRLEQRALPVAGRRPAPAELLKMARPALFMTTFNLAAVAALSLSARLPLLLPLPYALQWAETLWGAFRPAAGWKPTAVGLRQLAISSLFTVLFILAWR